MEERQVTVDGNTIELERPFMILATQNPIEYLGTYPLPEAQIDRFIMKLTIGYPDFEVEKEILRVFTKENPLKSLKSVVNKEDIIELQTAIKDIHAEEVILDYIVYLVGKTREHKDLELGASPRGSLFLLEAAKAWALYQGRTYVIPDDIQKVYLPIMVHRVIIKNEVKYDNISKEQLLMAILKSVAVPSVEEKNA
jgi:MoxR-like ATPase